MAKTNTRILITADALARAADAILARGDKLTKNAILNAMAAAIAGPGHDWGFLKNAPDGLLVQPGVDIPAAPGAPLPDKLWVLHYDERDDWSRAPMIFASQKSALDHMIAENWVAHPDHTMAEIVARVASEGEMTFPDADACGEEEFDESSPYQVWLAEVPVLGEPDAPIAPADREITDAEAAALDATCRAIVYFDEGPGMPRQGLDWETFYPDLDTFDAKMKEAGIELADVRDDTELLRDLKITAYIRPEAWQNDNAVEVDPEGETEWPIHAHEIRPAAGDLDYLKDSRHAPDWVRAWPGPFTISLTFERQSS